MIMYIAKAIEQKNFSKKDFIILHIMDKNLPAVKTPAKVWTVVHGFWREGIYYLIPSKFWCLQIMNALQTTEKRNFTGMFSHGSAW